MFATAKKQLRIPISKPEVYKPLVLILTITCLQHFSGFTFTKKFLLQVLAPVDQVEAEVVREATKEEDYTGYYFAILINAIRTAANLMMSSFLKRPQVAKCQNFNLIRLVMYSTRTLGRFMKTFLKVLGFFFILQLCEVPCPLPILSQPLLHSLLPRTLRLLPALWSPPPNPHPSC